MSIQSISPYLVASQGPDPYVNNNGQAAGMVRFNTTNQHLEAYDGMTWIRIANNDQSIFLTEDAVDAIRWTREKINEEQRLKELANKHPGIADAMQQLQRASEQLEIMVQLVNQDQTPVV